MERRKFLRLGLAPLLLAGNAFAGQEPEKRMSRAAQIGMFPNVPLISHTGEKVRLYDDLIRDKIILLNFMLVECTEGICPTATANLRKVQDLLGERMGRDIFFYSVTLQPKKDTPAILKEYADNFDIKPGWKFLTGKPADIDKLRRAQGMADWDPIRDKDVANHTAMGRYGDDRLDRWGSVGLRSTPENIASTFSWLSRV